MAGLILPFKEKKQYQLVQMELSNGQQVLAITSAFINEEQVKQLVVKKFLVYPPQNIPRNAEQVFGPLFDILKNTFEKMRII